MDIQRERKQFTSSHRRITRARRKYFYIVWRATNRARTDAERDVLMGRAVTRGIKYGLWSASTGDNQLRYSMIRRFYDLDTAIGKAEPEWTTYVMRTRAIPGGWTLGEHKSCKFKLKRRKIA